MKVLQERAVCTMECDGVRIMVVDATLTLGDEVVLDFIVYGRKSCIEVTGVFMPQSEDVAAAS